MFILTVFTFMRLKMRNGKIMRHISYGLLPDHIQDGMRLYLEQGIEPGSFCMAALCNDLVEAFCRADEINTECMKFIASWLYNECPCAARGSASNVAAWIAAGGFAGMEKRRFSEGELERSKP